MWGYLPFLDAHRRTPMAHCKVSFTPSAPDWILSWQVASGSPVVGHGLTVLLKLGADSQLLGSKKIQKSESACVFVGSSR